MTIYTSWMRMLLRKGFKKNEGLWVVEVLEVAVEVEEEEGEGEGAGAVVPGRGWAVWMISGGRNVRAVDERVRGGWGE